jgi:wyosine [tRNA(Phe)-imidazoG37] synthetase (radical SAM superfamily)
MSILFGPVLSRRLGVSLGIDIVKDGYCSYDCLYCEAGKTKCKTLDPSGAAGVKEVIENIEIYLSKNKNKIDYLTLSGTGEPTLNADIGRIIKKIKKKFKIPICLLTNSSMLSDHSLVKDISICDLIFPSLDAVSKDVFIKLNRPAPGVYTELILIGLKKLIEIAKGKVIIEILLVKGINDTKNELELLSKTVKELNPHGVDLNTVYRNPALNVEGVGDDELKEIGDKYFKDYLYTFEGKKILPDKIPDYNPNDVKFKKMLAIRGADIKDLSLMFKTDRSNIIKLINELTLNDNRYYTTEFSDILRLHYDFEK